MKKVVCIFCCFIFLGLFSPFAGCEENKDSENKVEVLAFTASWCGPCQRAKPVLAAIRASGVHVEIIDVDEHPELVKKHRIKSIPTFFVYVNDKVTRTQDISVVVRLVKRSISK